jgi:transcriptional regulator with XRE-family HTH domain
VAVLRLATGLSAEEFGQLIGKSLSTVKSLESGKLALSELTAAIIANKTDIAMRWLLAEDASAPMVDTKGNPWTVESYERARIKPVHPAGRWITPSEIEEQIDRLRTLLENQDQDFEMGTFAIVWYRVTAFLEKMEKDFPPQPVIEPPAKPKRKAKK